MTITFPQLERAGHARMAEDRGGSRGPRCQTTGRSDVAQGTCSIDGCESVVLARGWCSKHYQSIRKGVGLTDVRPKRALVDCPVVLADDLCFVPLTRNMFAVVDAADESVVEGRLWSASGDSRLTWYASSAKKLMHREVLGFGVGDPEVDHINGNGLDNRRANLRAVTRSQNSANRRPRAGGTSAYKGVSWNKQAGKWWGQIKVDYQGIHLGFFDSEADAARAYDAAALEYFGPYALVNFPTVGGDQ